MTLALLPSSGEWLSLYRQVFLLFCCFFKTFLFYSKTIIDFRGGARIAQSGWMTGVRFPTGERDFSLLHSVQTGSGAHPASYPMGTGGYFPEGKAARGVKLTSI
jgi:hypothetical protein